ncbi:HAMP domain-containing protein [Rhizobiaceae bacterium LC148]|nr:HAMP domain-containing protein [Rhizobiaceae bacterium LC148]
MTGWWRRSLAAQFICLILLALVVSQSIGLLVSWDERGQALRAAAKSEFLSRAASIAKLVEVTPPELKSDVLRASDTASTRFWISADSPETARAWQDLASAQLAAPLAGFAKLNKQQLPPLPPDPKVPKIYPVEGSAGTAAAASTILWTDLSPSAWPLSQPAKFASLKRINGMGLAVQLGGGAWLNAVVSKPIANAIWTQQSAISLAITALVLSGIGIFVARRIARPIRRLAVAAEALGRGEDVPPLPEQGPDDIRQMTEAFNLMQARLQRFVDDRTRMLAAIGHDLRTPITSLRLRAEFVSDPELQERMLATLDEMQSMTEATLAFAREEATLEETRSVDLTALISSLCDDLADLGLDVTFACASRIGYRCRPDALRRAIRNLVENAVRYGKRARVSLEKRADSLTILVEDDGPGIPVADFERVFVPFFRLEHSRNRETGGVGLGLSIARAIARHHGGDITLENISRGFQAAIRLPLIGQLREFPNTMPVGAQP